MPQLRIGYVREHHSQQQQDQLLANARVQQIFIEKADDAQRPQLKALLDSLQPGDTLVTYNMHHLAHNVDHLRRLIRYIGQAGAHIEFIQEGLTCSSAQSATIAFLLSLIAGVLQLTNTASRRRQRQALAQRPQKRRGRNTALRPAQQRQARQQVQDGKTKTQVAKAWGISRQTLYQYLKTDE